MAKHAKPSGDASRKPARRRRRRSRPSIALWILGGVGLVIALVAVVRATQDPEVIEDEPTEQQVAPPQRLRVEVLHRFPHDPDAFTQGLLWHEGFLYESTGMRGQSSLRQVDLTTGEVRRRRDMEPSIFAEGLARVDDRLIQLSWEAGVAQVYRLGDFSPIRRFRYEGEGWGLCYNGEHLVMSDGSSRLTFRSPTTFDVVRTLRVRSSSGSVRHLNELECVDGHVWANIWLTDEIVRIDPENGHVTATVDASDLLNPVESLGVDVLNGIAWIPDRGHFVITGKYWPTLFEVDFVPADPDEE